MIEGFSDVILIAKILFTFLSKIDWETLSKFYKFGNLPPFVAGMTSHLSNQIFMEKSQILEV
jgi:hypothetical protein